MSALWRRFGRPWLGCSPRRNEGFSLLEVLITSALTILIVAGVCQGVTLTLAVYSVSQQSWQATLELWNQANRFLAGLQAAESSFRPSPGSHPVERAVLAPTDASEKLRWEVLRAE